MVFLNNLHKDCLVVATSNCFVSVIYETMYLVLPHLITSDIRHDIVKEVISINSMQNYIKSPFAVVNKGFLCLRDTVTGHASH
jgi:hypothetical protein